MSDRDVRRGLRGLVLVVMACLVIATWGVRLTLSSGSGTFYGYLIYLPVLAAPGWLVWRQPRARWLAAWAAVGWAATIVHQIVGQPYRYERALPGWSSIEIPLAIAWIRLFAIAVPLMPGPGRPS